jgi:hypothetical protein
LEAPGFKANYVFDHYFGSTFGFNKDAHVLLSIVNKSLALIDTEIISGRWLRMTYDYRLAMVEAQRPWMIGAMMVLALALISFVIAYWENKMKNLETELKLVLEELKPLADEIAAQAKSLTLDSSQTSDLFKKLEPMLENNNPECEDLLESIRAVPGAEELARQIENFNFKAAAETLLILKEKQERKNE